MVCVADGVVSLLPRLPSGIDQEVQLTIFMDIVWKEQVVIHKLLES